MDVRRTSLTAHETRNRILDAAQALFVAHGFEATSMRMITGDAGVNLAAVNYHFGSKDVLVREVLKRHLQPLNAQRMLALDAAETEAGDQPVKPHRIVDAFFSSSLDLASGSAAGREFMQLLGRTFTEPSPTVREYLATEYAPVIGRYRDAFCRALPTVPVEEILWRLHFMLGAMSYAVSGIDSLQVLTGVRIDEPDAMQRMRPRLMSFLLGGLRAPLPAGQGTDHTT
ncbi:MAG: TetR family transcriptional regulator [Methyloversatilis sp.]|uniref:TetR/AcrR family transcriptional regulator n=1 Tax=Methyloversatilis sp. TaxID=2569862 RepID=UPI001A520330|nr:TetR/AcrR family transcriptional regulator [Methyloversatilis sp.]MBL8476439.1 TetR family transcriptional regulator [Methyloversatilis sp.]